MGSTSEQTWIMMKYLLGLFISLFIYHLISTQYYSGQLTNNKLRPPDNNNKETNSKNKKTKEQITPTVTKL